MTRTQTAIAVVSALLLVLAGCTGGLGGAPTGDLGSTAATTEDVETTAPSEDVGDGDDGGATEGVSAISFYLSDKPSAIDDFEHLNVTITRVGFHRVAPNETEAPTETTAATPTTTTTVTTTEGAPTATLTAETESSAPEATTSRTSVPNEGEESEDRDGGPKQDKDRDSDHDREQDGDGNGEWVTKDVNDTTVDLTELKGANATKLDVLEVAPGTYNKVFIYVGEINATLTNGEGVHVKLPSERLHVNKRFTVGDGDEIDFVFDVSVFEAGKSGKYILKPVVSQTGTGDEVEIDSIDEDDESAENDGADEKNEAGKEADGEDRDEATERGEEANETEAGELTADLRGPVRPGSTVPLAVTRTGEPVSNATVEVNDERAGTTDADGTIDLEIPNDAEELEITVATGEAELEIERSVRGNGGGNGNDG